MPNNVENATSVLEALESVLEFLQAHGRLLEGFRRQVNEISARIDREVMQSLGRTAEAKGAAESVTRALSELTMHVGRLEERLSRLEADVETQAPSSP